MGPHGTLLPVVGLPFVVAGLFLLCSPEGCPPAPLTDPAALWKHVATAAASVEWFSADAMTAVAVWFGLHMVLPLVLGGKVAKGSPLRNGQTLSYPINGFRALVVVAAAMLLHTRQQGLDRLVWIADHSLQLFTAAATLATSLAVSLYVSSFRGTERLADGSRGPVLLSTTGNSGYPIYDFWMGRELNPRVLWGSIDLKYLCELRPGLIGWCLLNAAFAAKEYTTTGAVSPAMIAVCVFQGYYVIDALWNEEAILTTMDITTDGFGFMLAYGDLAWVPFSYTVQARFLIMFPQQLSPAYLALICTINLIGIWIFRSSNGEKNDFRTNPDGPSVKHLKYMETKSGRKLLVSGWWGAARKINYTGDWLMALAWSLPCGFSSIVPYFYPIYFAVLLIHRSQRDDMACRLKYGADWDEYRKRVPYVFIPYVY
nr:hypothetical protein HK105_005274 [Polyrhizophydium stewartii]